MHYLLNWVGGCFYLTVYTSGNRFTFKMKRMLIFLSSCYFPNGLHNVLLGKLSVRFFQYGFWVPQRSFSILLSGLLQLTDVWSEEWNRFPTATLIWPWGFRCLDLPASQHGLWRSHQSKGLSDFGTSAGLPLWFLLIQALKSFLGLQLWLPSISLQCLIFYLIVIFILFKKISIFFWGLVGLTNFNL